MTDDATARARAILAASMRLNEQSASADAIESGDPGFFLLPAGVALHAIAAAVAGERERCARVVDDNRTDDGSMWDRAAETIAAAIRGGGC